MDNLHTSKITIGNYSDSGYDSSGVNPNPTDATQPETQGDAVPVDVPKETGSPVTPPSSDDSDSDSSNNNLLLFGGLLLALFLFRKKL